VNESTEKAQPFGPLAGRHARAGLIVAGSIVAVTLFSVWYTYWTARYRQGSRLAQPILFSHQHHAGLLGIDCRYCHGGVDKGAFAGMPSTDTCLSCHSQVFSDSPMLREARASLMSGIPLAWLRVHDLRDIAYFRHDVHVNKGVSCVSCHGRVDQMPLVAQTAPLTMSWCLDCHRDPAPRLVPGELVFDLPAAEAWLARNSGRLPPPEHVATYNLTSCNTCHR